MPLALTPHVFAILRAVVEERLGFRYADEDREIFASKVGARAEEMGFESFLDYYYFLRYDPAGAEEMEALAEHLVVNETYLFREREQLDTVVDSIVAPEVRAGRRVRLWSAACSTGEEPLTLAMLLAARGLLDSVDIVATDVSARALAHARRGLFSRRAIRQESTPAEAARWITRTEQGITVAPELVARIEWGRLNLLDGERVARMGLFHVIFCRNVFIYFSDAVTKSVVENLKEALVPGGVLAVGVSESLMRFGTVLVCDERSGTFLYRRAT